PGLAFAADADQRKSRSRRERLFPLPERAVGQPHHVSDSEALEFGDDLGPREHAQSFSFRAGVASGVTHTNGFPASSISTSNLDLALNVNVLRAVIHVVRLRGCEILTCARSIPFASMLCRSITMGIPIWSEAASRMSSSRSSSR